MQQIIKTRHLDSNTGQWEISYATPETLVRIAELKTPDVFACVDDNWIPVTETNISHITHFIPPVDTQH